MFAWQLTAVEYNTEGVIINRKLSTAIKDALHKIFHLRKEIVEIVIGNPRQQLWEDYFYVFQDCKPTLNLAKCVLNTHKGDMTPAI